MNREDIKLGLLGLITLLVIVNTYLLVSNSGESDPVVPAKAGEVTTNAGNNGVPTPAVQNNNPAVNPTTPPPVNDATQNTGPTTTMKFEKYEHDYGTVAPLSNNPYTFKFTNTGDVPLVIENARGTCGCTVPDWPKEPIMPNQTGEIKVVFTPKETQLGSQEKQVIITANVPTKTVNLKIKANVVQ